MENKASSKSKASVVSVILILMALIGYFLFSTPQNQSFPSYNIEKNEVTEITQPTPVIKQKLKPTTKKIIPKISPLSIGQPGISFSGKIRNIIVSPDGQTLAVATVLGEDLFHIYLVDSYRNKINDKIVVDRYLSAMVFAGSDKLVFRHSLDNTHKIIIYDILGQEIINEIDVALPYGAPLASSVDGRLFVAACDDLYQLKNKGHVSAGFKSSIQKSATIELERYKKAFTSDNTQWIKGSKAALYENFGINVEDYNDLLRQSEKIKKAFYDQVIQGDSRYLAHALHNSNTGNDILIFDLNTGKLTGVIEDVFRPGFKGEVLLFNETKNELVVIDKPKSSSSHKSTSKNNYQTISRYDLASLKLIQTLKNKSSKMIKEGSVKLGTKDNLLGRFEVDFKNSTVSPGHLYIFAIDYKNARLYRSYPGIQRLLCKNLNTENKLFQIEKVGREYDHIRINPVTNELILWKNGESIYARFDLANKKLIEDVQESFSSIPYQLFFKGNNELIVEESNNFHTYDLTSGVRSSTFHFDKNARIKNPKSFIINNDKNLLTGGCRDGKAHLLDLKNGERIKSLGEGYVGGRNFYSGLETMHINAHADLAALKLSFKDKLAVHKISSGEKVFSLKSAGWIIGRRQNVHVQFNDSGSLMYLGDNGYGSKSVNNSGIYDLDSGTKNTFTLKNGKEVSVIYDMVVNDKADLIFMRTVDDKTHYTGVWDATTGKCVKEIKSSDDFEVMQGFKPSKIPVEGISNDGRYLLTANGAYDIDNDRFVWNWQNTSDGLKPSGTTIIDETQLTIVNISHDFITVKNALSGKTLKQFRLVLPEDKSVSSITGGIWSSEINKLVLKLKEPEIWIFDLNKEAI